VTRVRGAGVRALLRDTIEDSEVYQALLGYDASAGTDTQQAPPGPQTQVPLLLAAAQGQREIAEALMQAGANPRARDAQGRTASQVRQRQRVCVLCVLCVCV
jgi:hypothetical protein